MGRTNLHKMCFSHILMACVISGVIITREIIKKKIHSAHQNTIYPSFLLSLMFFFSFSSSYRHCVINQTLSLVSQKNYSIGGSVKK